MEAQSDLVSRVVPPSMSVVSRLSFLISLPSIPTRIWGLTQQWEVSYKEEKLPSKPASTIPASPSLYLGLTTRGWQTHTDGLGMELGRNLIFRVENDSTWGEGRSKDSRQSSSRRHVQKRVEFALRAFFVYVVFFRGMFMSDQRWSSCYTLSDGKGNHNCQGNSN